MSQTAIVAGPDPDGLGEALESEGLTVRRIEGQVSRASLDDADVTDAQLLVVTDMAEATGVALAKDENPEIRAAFYSPESLPEFIKGQADLAVDPELLDVSVVAEELAADS